MEGYFKPRINSSVTAENQSIRGRKRKSLELKTTTNFNNDYLS